MKTGSPQLQKKNDNKYNYIVLKMKNNKINSLKNK